MQECSWVAEADAERSELCEGRELRDRSWAGLTGQPVDVDVRGLGDGWEGRCRGTACGSKAVGIRGEAVPTPMLSYPAR